MTWWEILIIIVAVAFVVGVIAATCIRKKRGKTSCGCGCESCMHSAACAKAREKKKTPPQK